jgi:Cation transport ATPase (P-type)
VPADKDPVLPLMGRAELVEDNGGWKVQGDPTEGALYPFATKFGMDRRVERAASPRIDLIPFELIPFDLIPFAAVGLRVFPGMVASSGNRLILAVQRGGETLPPRETALAAGDALLVQGTWDALEANEDDADVLVVEPPTTVRRQAVPMGPGAGRRSAC